MSPHSLVIRTDQGFLKDEVPQFWSCLRLIFIPAVSHASAKLFNMRWRPDSEEQSRTKLLANSRRLILHLPIVANFLSQYTDKMATRVNC